MIIIDGTITRDQAEDIRLSSGLQNIPNFGDALFYNDRPCGAVTGPCDTHGLVYDRWYARVAGTILGPFGIDDGIAAIGLKVID